MRARLAIAAMMMGACFGPQCSVGRQRHEPGHSVAVLATRMCECADRACVDRVNEEMTRFGTEMAASTRGTNDEPDPVRERESKLLMNRYVECMTRLIVSAPQRTVISRP